MEDFYIYIFKSSANKKIGKTHTQDKNHKLLPF